MRWADCLDPWYANYRALTIIALTYRGRKVDSLLGATVQQTRFSAWEHRILTDESKPGPDVEIKIISGVNILTNNQVSITLGESESAPVYSRSCQVNLISSILTALFVGKLGSYVPY